MLNRRLISSSILPLLIFFSFSYVACGGIDISLSPTPIVAGEPAYLSIKSDEGIAQIDDFPDLPGIRWINKSGNGSNVIVINGQRYDITQYSFIADKPGKVTLPSLKIKYDGKEIETQQKDITVTSGFMTDVDKFIYIDPKFNLKGKIYAGESVQLDIYLNRALNVEAVPSSYPQVSIDNVVFDTFNSKNSGDDRFATYPYYPPEKIEKDGITYERTCFTMSFRPISSGTLKGIISLPVEVTVPGNSGHSMVDSRFFNSSMFDDPFFNRGKRISKILSASIPSVEVLPLPEQPSNTIFLGLFGKWDLTLSASPGKLAEGETLTIKVDLSGYGSLETLKAPEISLPGFTAYKPEIVKNQAADQADGKSTASITYLLIPKEPGKINLSLCFATFNTLNDKYDINPLEKSIEVIKNNSLSSQMVQSSAPSPEFHAPGVSKSTKYESSSILYIKKEFSGAVEVPLWKNHLAADIIIALMGILIFLSAELIRKRKESITEESLRKQMAMRRKGKLINMLRVKKDSDLYNFIDSDIVPFINDISGFPPGTTSHELQNKLNDQMLSNALKEANLSRFMPAKNPSSEQELKANLIKGLKKYSALIVVFFLVSLPLRSGASQTDDFSSEYNKGNFSKAEEICLSNINQEKPDPAWIYNLGNTCFQEGRNADAMLYYQRALLLNPRDQDTLQNLNYVRRLLFLPELYKTRTPFDILIYTRDLMRPDEWLILSSIFFFILMMVFTFRRRFSFYPLIITSLVFAMLSICAATMSFYQYRTLYSNKNALVMVKNPSIHALPSEDSPDVKMPLSIGDEVKIQDRIDDWILISTQSNKTTGWIKSGGVARIWPY